MSDDLSPMLRELTHEGRRFRAVVKRCGHEGCDGEHLYLDEQNDAGERLDGGLRFKTAFPIPDEDLDDAEPLVIALLGKLPGRWRESYAGELLPPDEEHFAKVRFPKDHVRNGYLQPYLDVVQPEGSVMVGGTHVDFAFDFEGRSIVVVEMFCPSPECDCGVGSLVFLEEQVLGEGEVEFTDLFRADVTLVGERRDVVGDEPQLEPIYAEFIRLFAPDLTHLTHRYEAVRVVGRRSLEPRKFTKAPSKNALCPCGSGKKYKSCCGR